MADSYYDILEYRCVVNPETTDLYIRISDANDFMPIAGWYKNTIPASEASLAALGKALADQSFLQWKREAPPGEIDPAHIQQSAGPLAVWWSMVEAHQQLIDEPIADKSTVLHFMGSGASTMVTARDIRAMFRAIYGPEKWPHE